MIDDTTAILIYLDESNYKVACRALFPKLEYDNWVPGRDMVGVCSGFDRSLFQLAYPRIHG